MKIMIISLLAILMIIIIRRKNKRIRRKNKRAFLFRWHFNCKNFLDETKCDGILIRSYRRQNTSQTNETWEKIDFMYTSAAICSKYKYFVPKLFKL